MLHVRTPLVMQWWVCGLGWRRTSLSSQTQRPQPWALVPRHVRGNRCRASHSRHLLEGEIRSPAGLDVVGCLDGAHVLEGRLGRCDVEEHHGHRVYAGGFGKRGKSHLATGNQDSDGESQELESPRVQSTLGVTSGYSRQRMVKGVVLRLCSRSDFSKVNLISQHGAGRRAEGVGRGCCYSDFWS